MYPKMFALMSLQSCGFGIICACYLILMEVRQNFYLVFILIVFSTSETYKGN